MLRQMYKCEVLHLISEPQIITKCEFTILESFILVVKEGICNWYPVEDVILIENVTPINTPQNMRARRIDF